MKKTVLSQEVQEFIVRNGTKKKSVDKQIIRKPEPVAAEPFAQERIFLAFVDEDWTQNQERNVPIVAHEDGEPNVAHNVYSPLSRYRDSLASGTRIFVVERRGNFLLLNAECPE